jgi:hypothetical protein
VEKKGGKGDERREKEGEEVGRREKEKGEKSVLKVGYSPVNSLNLAIENNTFSIESIAKSSVVTRSNSPPFEARRVRCESDMNWE